MDNPIEFAQKLLKGSERFRNDLDNQTIPDINSDLNKQVFILMCVASSGREGTSEKAMQMLWDDLIDASATLEIIKMVHNGAIMPVEMEDGGLGFKKGIKFDEYASNVFIRNLRLDDER